MEKKSISESVENKRLKCINKFRLISIFADILEFFVLFSYVTVFFIAMKYITQIKEFYIGIVLTLVVCIALWFVVCIALWFFVKISKIIDKKMIISIINIG